ncbi:MAG: divalent-cation tolerance protein CutA [Candidatus Gastranaerophilales bacterium]|nr:divalent-cation tolerance protein CutA [Candidatus Gastranaerophilales bacterium]
MSYCIVLTTTAKKIDALKIARALVVRKLCACVNIAANITSVYEWKDELCEEEEFLLIIKSVDKNFDNIKKTIIELHPYELCEVIQIPVTKGYDKYLEWISNSSKQA